MNLSFYSGKKVLITGHTGFKGSWMSLMLIDLGAEVSGYSLEPPTEPNLYQICGLKKQINSIIGDIRDLKHLKQVFLEVQPEIVIHMAAQPLVRESYQNPVYTYETNVMGTVNVLECIRTTSSVESFLNVTTDKVYLNREWEWGYRENEELNGYDPYSNSKSCSELVTSSFKKSFFQDKSKRVPAISTARAGNVIGGGDFAADRIIPDCARAFCKGENVIIRNPFSIRPYEHVLEPVTAYLVIAWKQYEDRTAAGSYNVGPNDEECIPTGKLAELFAESWNLRNGTNLNSVVCENEGPHEATYLKLDCSKIKRKLGWKPKWNIEKTIKMTVEWYDTYYKNEDMQKCMRKQIKEFIEDNNEKSVE